MESNDIFADTRFMSIFSMLFGAGVVLFTQRIEAKGKRVAAFAPFLRCYIGSSNIKPYLHGEVGLGTEKSKTPGVSNEFSTSADIFLYELGGGIGIFLNEKVSLDIGLAYASVSFKRRLNNLNFKDIANGFGLGIGFVIVLQ